MRSIHKQLESIREVDLCIAASPELVRHTTPDINNQGRPFPQTRHPLATRHPSLKGYCFNCYSDGICTNQSCIFKHRCHHAMVSMQLHRTLIEIPHHITLPPLSCSLFFQGIKAHNTGPHSPVLIAPIKSRYEPAWSEDICQGMDVYVFFKAI